MRRIIVTLIGLSLPLFASAADMDAGREKARACTACHGANGVSVSDDIPNLSGQKATYIQTQLKAFRGGRRKNALMNAMAAQLSDTDIENVAAFFNSLSSPAESAMSSVGAALNESKIAFPQGYQKTFTLYSKTNQAGKKRVRHNYANKAGMQGPDSRGALADGTFIVTEVYGAKLDKDGKPVRGADGFFEPGKLLVIAAMEKRRGWGDAIPVELRNANWNYTLFTPEKMHKKGVNQAKCLACHKPLHDADYLFTYEALVKKTQ